MGMKTYDFVSNPSRFYVQLYDATTAELIALIEANGMGQVRTGAASGVATKYMARADASTVGMIGSGYQARHAARSRVQGQGHHERENLLPHP